MKKKTGSVSGTKKTIITIIFVIIFMLLLALVGFLLYIKTVFIGDDKVKQIIINDMNVLESNVYFESIDLELDKKCYDVELYYDNKEYEYKLDAEEGKIIYTDFKNVNYTPNVEVTSSNGTTTSGQNVTTTTSSTNEIGIDKALEIALKDAKLGINDVMIIKKQREYDDGIIVYDIEFHHDNYEYEYEIKALDGTILDFQKERLFK